MALINTIREKSGWAVGTVAVGMILFIVGSDFVGGKNRLFGGNDNVVGEVAGQKVDRQQFENALEQAKQGFVAQQQRQPDEQAMGFLRDQAWNQTLYRLAFQPEYEKLGLTVSDAELIDMVQGNNIAPGVRQAFTDPKTGQFDVSAVQDYLRKLEKGPPEARDTWQNYERGIANERLMQKYVNLLKNSTYVTTAEARRFNETQNTRASLRYLFVPYASISDSAVKPTNAQLQAYLDKNKGKYKVEDGRTIEYISIPVAPSKDDSTAVTTNMATLATQFRTAPVDSLFVAANSDQPYNGAFRTPADLPEVLRRQLPLTAGQVVGPLAENGTSALYKIVAVKDGKQAAARASHILIKPAGPTPEAKAAAKAQAQNILNKIKAGADFGAMARQFGTDGTKDLGGDLGWFGQGRMVPEFEKAIFGATSAGLLPAPVETSFGYHVIKITAPKTFKSYQIAEVRKSLTPSEATRDAAYQKAQALLGEATSLEAFRKLPAKDKTLVKQEAKDLDRNARSVNNLQNARDIVRWAYGVSNTGETKVGAISEVFEVGDQYVIAALTGERSKGSATVTGLRNELLAPARSELKAQQIMAKLQGKTGTLEALAQAYGPTAQVLTADNVVLSQPNLPGAGFEPLAVGRALALKPGQKSAPIQGEQGVLVVEAVKTAPAPAVADVKALRQQLIQQRQQRADGQIYEAIKAHANVKDNRAKFY